ncbi:hypothetical protein PO909_002398 [Leuciscus waleckii]
MIVQNVRVFLLENSALVGPSSRGKRDRHLGPVVRVRLVLRHCGDSDHGVPRWSSLTSLREAFLSHTRQKLARDVLSLINPAASALLAPSPREQERANEGKEEWTTDLALRATRQTTGHEETSVADIGEKQKGFLLDAPVSPSELFGTSVETVAEKFREAKARSVAYKSCIPLRSESTPRQPGGPGPSRFEDQRRPEVQRHLSRSS